MIPPTTTPPATILFKKFVRDGEAPDAASATSGITMYAANVAAVRPETIFSFKDAFTWSLEFTLDDEVNATAFDDFNDGIAFKKEASELNKLLLFWLDDVNGIAIETAEVDAISLSNFSFSNSKLWMSGKDLSVVNESFRIQMEIIQLRLWNERWKMEISVAMSSVFLSMWQLLHLLLVDKVIYIFT